MEGSPHWTQGREVELVDQTEVQQDGGSSRGQQYHQDGGSIISNPGPSCPQPGHPPTLHALDPEDRGQIDSSSLLLKEAPSSCLHLNHWEVLDEPEMKNGRVYIY